MNELTYAGEVVGVFAAAFVGAKIGRGQKAPKPPEPNYKYCLCTHVRSHHVGGAGSCYAAVGKNLSMCACQKFFPDTERDLEEREKKLGIVV